ncbi:hypothetical protein L1887_30081 [Cichorium endivia]|nr:hypothetical protein L1887_30081 [Cichorium endivia]
MVPESFHLGAKEESSEKIPLPGIVRSYCMVPDAPYTLQLVSIPLAKIKEVGEDINLKSPSDKYIELITVDDFNFWFLGFLNYNKILRYLHQIISHNSVNN